MNEFDYSSGDFQRIRSLIRERAGIALAESKREMAYGRVARLVRAGQWRSFAEYLDHLQAKGSSEDWQAFVNALTTNLTSFFREEHHFGILATHLVRAGAARPQRIWCCAASTGEEPWSLAITACEAFGSLSPPVEIIATDIDTACLQTAAQAVYPLARIDSISMERKRRFFQRGSGSRAGMVRVHPALHKLVRFLSCNVLDTRWPVEPPLDALFCRNLMIYFDKPTQHALLRRMVPLLRPDGLFFAGHSESFFHAADVVRACGQTVYAPVRSAVGCAA